MGRPCLREGHGVAPAGEVGGAVRAPLSRAALAAVVSAQGAGYKGRTEEALNGHFHWRDLTRDDPHHGRRAVRGDRVRARQAGARRGIRAGQDEGPAHGAGHLEDPQGFR
ncbi:protein of unknown function [Candidatus Bipolaricaulis anaerobius]|uniref:Uncharacterized protein n=1 Tax=Candidatus Bipolaricaulis anaerobius TaxID=2026885 RepID=A0A2X3L151_9BACT|nr:protein of unknown function [Candidatus Bipolaricaulis anaerobius]